MYRLDAKKRQGRRSRYPGCTTCRTIHEPGIRTRLGVAMGLSGITEQVKLFSIGALTCCMLLCSAIPARAEYLIGVGDALEISVAGVPELRQRVTVELDGSISYPLLETTFMVAGLSPSAVRAKLRATLPSKLFRRQTPEGR